MLENKKCEVIMLPTEKTTVGQIVKLKQDDAFDESKKGNLVINVNPNVIAENKWCIPQHLYFISTEEIKEGDWCYLTLKPGICQYKIGMGLEWLKKIVATTDPELWYKDIDNKCIHCGFVKEQPYGICPSCARFQNQNYQQLVPKIPISFLEPFITAYNAGTPITQVLLETGEYHGLNTSLTEISSYSNNPVNYGKDLRLKLRNNEVIIRPIKEDTILFKEMIEFVKWYSGAREQLVINAYNRWLNEKE